MERVDNGICLELYTEDKKYLIDTIGYFHEDYEKVIDFSNFRDQESERRFT